MQNRTDNPAVVMHGVYVALATPRESNDVEADAGTLLDYIDTIVATGVDGLVLFGSTGEFVHYDIAERIRVLSLASKRSRVPLFVNISHSSFAAAVSLAENAIEAGAAGILLMPPYFFRYSDDQLFSFYQQFSTLIDGATPVYLYNIPFFTNPMSATLLKRLLSTGAFSGIKDSSGEWPLFEAVQSVRDQATFQNIIGNDGMYARARAAGADGIVSGVAAAVPELLVALDRALVSQEPARTQALQARLEEFLSYLDQFPATIAIKQAAVVRGWKLDNAALPFDEATLTQLKAFRAWFEQWLPDVLAESIMRPSSMDTQAQTEPSCAISADEFLSAAYAHADWIAHYLDNTRDYPVFPAIQPGSIALQLPASAPEQPEPLDQIFADFKDKIFPGLTLWNHPHFFGYFATSSPPASILAEFLTASMNANLMLWRTSPAATELEQVTLSWLRQWPGLGDEFFGIIYDTASIGVMQALGAAREMLDPECRTRGMRPGLAVYVSEHTHNSSEKAALLLGFGRDNIRRIPVDAEFRMQPALLEQAIEADKAAGRTPCFIVVSVGSTSTSAIEPVDAVAELAERHGAWLHVDAAYAGSAAVVPEYRHILKGAERAHSLVLNPHKWLQVGMDCSVLYTRFPDILRRSVSLSAEYLKTPEDDQVVNFNDYGLQLGRRFRALKLWYVMRAHGRQGMIGLLRKSMQQAQLLKQLIEADLNFELAAPMLLSLVCFRHRESNELNQRLLAEINASGKIFLSHTVLNGRFVLRCAFGNYLTTEEDVHAAWRLIRDTALLCAANG